MKFSLRWLNEYVDLPDAEKLRQDIEAHAFEVEDLEHFARDLDSKIVVAEVISWQQHPNADRLRVVELKAGDKTISPVVCGAKNFDQSDKVALALPGALIPHDQHDPEGKPFNLGKATIRDVESQGMICSAAELGLSGDHEGIIILPTDAKTGVPVAEVLGDTFIDVNVQSTNRADVQQYLGLARDIAVIEKADLKMPETYSLPVDLPAELKVAIKEPELCQRYIGVVIKNIKVSPSPAWLVSHLGSAGIRSINNIVDITNFVMLEMGQPMHAFDADKVSEIVVKRAKAGETVTTLDSVERKLSENVLLITDGKSPLAIAGIMGALESGITEGTKSIILELAKFESIFTRRASRELNLRTDASSRFEKNLSLDLPYYAALRAIKLILDIAGGEVIGFTDEFPGAAKRVAHPVEISLANIERLLGKAVDSKEINSLLTAAGFAVQTKGESIIVTAPWWRTDVTLAEDVVEEIGRLHGFDSIVEQPIVMPQAINVRPSLTTQFKRTIQNSLAEAGFWETTNYSFLSDDSVKVFGLSTEKLVEIINPIDANQKYLRPALLPNLIEALLRNAKKYNKSLAYYELGDVFFDDGTEVVNVAGAIVGGKDPQQTLGFAKGGLEHLARKLSLPELTFKPTVLQPLSPVKESGGTIVCGDKAIGTLGIVNPAIAATLGLKEGYAAYFELIDVESILALRGMENYQAPPRFPASSFDISVLADESKLWSEIAEPVNKVLVEQPEIESKLELITVYRDLVQLPEGKKSLTMRITLRHPVKTMTQEEVKAINSKVAEHLVKIGAQVRE